MTRPGFATRHFVVLLLVVVGVAAGIRVANVVVWRPTCVEDFVALAEQAQAAGGEQERGEGALVPAGEPGCYQVANDALYHHLQARLLAEGEGFVDGPTWFYRTMLGLDDDPTDAVRPSAGDPPLYALVLGGISAVGLETATDHRLASAAMGALGIAVIGLAGRRVAGARAGLVAAALGAVYPMLWINDGMLLSESLYAPLAGLVVLTAYRWWDRPGTARAVAVGLGIGFASLARAEALALVGFLLLPLGWGIRARRGTRHALGDVAAAGAVAVLCVAPWLGFNLGRFEQPVFMTSGTGAVLSAGACDTTFDGPLTGYYGNCFDEYVADGLVEGWPDPEVLDEAQRDAVSREGALRYLSDHTADLPRVAVARIGRMWDLYEPAQNVRLNWQIEGRGRAASELGFGMYLVLAPLAVAGTVVLWRRRVPVSPLLAFPAAVTLTAAATFGATRYRVPADLCLVILASVALDALARRRWPVTDGDRTVPRVGRRSRRGRPTGEQAGPHATPDLPIQLVLEPALVAAARGGAVGPAVGAAGSGTGTLGDPVTAPEPPRGDDP